MATSQQKPKLTASVTKMAAILGVSHQSVSRAITSGRLQESVKGESPNREIEIFMGCHEWVANRVHSKVRSNVIDDPELCTNPIPSCQESRKVIDYATAIIKWAEMEEQLGNVIPVSRIEDEVFTATRAARDRFLSLGEEVRRLMVVSGATEGVSEKVTQFIKNKTHGILDELSRTDFSAKPKQTDLD